MTKTIYLVIETLCYRGGWTDSYKQGKVYAYTDQDLACAAKEALPMTRETKEGTAFCEYQVRECALIG